MSPSRPLLVIGASAGGIEVMRTLFAALPGDLPASIFVVQHVDANSPVVLPKILDQAGPLPVTSPQDGEPYRAGVAYVARPDLHLLLDEGRMILRRGPRENLCRPAIDPLFRSAALIGGPDVVGVVLSGNLNDGTAGLAAIKRCGGVTVAQNPEDATWPDMPRSAIEEGVVDYVEDLENLPDRLTRLIAERLSGETRGRTGSNGDGPPEDLRLEHRIAAQEATGIDVEETLGDRSVFTCPECHGPLWEMKNSPLTTRFRCHVGHAFTAETMLAGQSDALERALWSALQAHQQRAALTREMARKARRRGQNGLASNWDARTQEYDQHADVIRRILLREVEPDSKTGEETAGSDAEPIAIVAGEGRSPAE